MTKRILIITLITLFNVTVFSQSKGKLDKSTVKELDLERFMGKWYEIARFDHSFERGLEGVTATYTLKENGKIDVLNEGYKKVLGGERSKSRGKAKRPDPNKPGALKVSFFWFFYADYLVMELDRDYQWALIGSSSSKYLWILSRTPQLNHNVLQHIINKAKKRGYNTDKLIYVDQPEN